ncbi:MAG: hypothetical protein AAFV07_21305, partial [Bacteroidota bacterium]
EQIAGYQILLEDICLEVVQDSALYTEGWDTLAQPAFWQQIMRIGPDTTLVNIAKTRQIVGYIDTYNWMLRSEKRKKKYEDSIRNVYGLKAKDEIYFTHGRSHFYRIQAMLPAIDQAIEVFREEEVDPWYAQTILLIESPGRLQHSIDGAYGAFQLMEGVAKEMGLVINDTIDERADFHKSAKGAARLIDRVCLPHTRALCRKWGLGYREDEIWFRLLTMHVYHAGIGNVRRVMRKVRPDTGGVPLFKSLWQKKSRRFGNASQNYSQIALAALLELDVVLSRTGILCPPDEERISQGDSADSFLP